MKEKGNVLLNNLLYSCVAQRERGHEQFVEDHVLGYVIAGETYFFTNKGKLTLPEGSIGIARGNQLVKTVKVPPPTGEFESINIFFSQDILRRYSNENGIHITEKYTGEGMRSLSGDPFIKGFFDSLLPYLDKPGHLTKAMVELKTKEAIELLLKHDPMLKNFLFDFSEPYKIDLEAFMNQNYMYNVTASHFARLTGRSLAGFKRDFEKIFNAAPGQWLQQKRLSEAYYLIKEKGKKPSDVYLDVGFENLSHFSYAFKKAYGVPPSQILS